MKLKTLLMVAVLALTSIGLQAQAQIIRGEVSPGVYTNVGVDATGAIEVTGTTAGSKAAGVAATESTLTGGVYNTTLPTLANGQQAAVQLGTRGAQHVQLMIGDTVTGVATILTGADAISNTSINSLRVTGFGEVFNGTSWDRQRGTVNGTSIIPSVGAVTNRSGTITTGGTSQQIMAANATRRYLLIQNISDTVMWCNFAIAAVQDQPSFRIGVGESFTMQNLAVSSEAIHCIGATAAKAFVAKEM
jgi:hypothetical protein